MIEELTRSAVETLLAQGTGWVVAVLVGLLAYLLDRRLVKLQKEYDANLDAAEKKVSDQYEKRLVESRELLEVINNSTMIMTTMEHSIKSINTATNDLGSAVTKLVREFEADRLKWSSHAATAEKSLEDIQRRVEALQRRKTA